MLHRSCDRALVKRNHSYDNADAGLALYESSDCKVLRNTFESNKRESVVVAVFCFSFISSVVNERPTASFSFPFLAVPASRKKRFHPTKQITRLCFPLRTVKEAFFRQAETCCGRYRGWCLSAPQRAHRPNLFTQDLPKDFG